MIQNPNHAPVPATAPFSILSQQHEPCGRLFKNTKKRLSWKFQIEDNIHELTCTVSKLSGKRLVLLDNDCLIEIKTEDESFRFEHEFKGVYLRLYLYKDSGQLYLEKESSNRVKVGTCLDAFLGMENLYSCEEVVDVYGEYY